MVGIEGKEREENGKEEEEANRVCRKRMCRERERWQKDTEHSDIKERQQTDGER